MRRPAALLASALLLFLVIPQASASQTLVDDRLEGYADLVEKEGFLPVTGYQGGMLREGNDSRFSVTLESGAEYRIIGYCDEDCEDLDLTLYDPYGDLIESDILLDAAPLLSFTAGSNGRFEVEVSMVTCTLEPCGWGVGVFGRGHEAAFEDDALWDDFWDLGSVAELLALLEEGANEEGYTRVGDIVTGWLNDGGEENHYLTLSPGAEYAITGMCDGDCEDLDLFLYDPNGVLMESDVAVDDIPVLEFSDPAMGQYRLEVGMVTCTVEPCEYGVLVLRRGGSAGSGRIVSETTHPGSLGEGDSRRSDGEFFDRYAIELNAGQHITVDMRSTDFDTYLVLVSPARERTENDDYGGSTAHSRIQMVAHESGKWEILASSFSSGSTGSYEVSVTIREGGR